MDGMKMKGIGRRTWTDIFSSDLTWDPQLAWQAEPRNVMSKIVSRLESWLELENIPIAFGSLPKYGPQDICDVPSVLLLLRTIVEFLEGLENSEILLSRKLLSASIRTEKTRMKHLWWVLSRKDKGLGNLAEKLLGRRLRTCLVNYSSSRKALRESVLEKLLLIQAWAGAYSNGEAEGVLEEVYRDLRKVFQNFQAWQTAVSVAVIRKGWDKGQNRLMSVMEIQEELNSLEVKLKQPSSSPRVDPSEMRKKQDCSSQCIFNTEFLHFSRGQSLQIPQIRKSAVPVRSQSERVPVSSVDSGHSGSSPSQVSTSWPESELSSYASEVPGAGANYLSNSNVGGQSFGLIVPESQIYLHAGGNKWEDSASVSETDAEDLSEVFMKSVNICQDESLSMWTPPMEVIGRSRVSSTFTDEGLDCSLQRLQAVIPPEASPQFWQNIVNLASISDQ